MDILLKYFPDLSAEQINHFQSLKPLYKEWNAQINVISRKDMDFSKVSCSSIFLGPF